MGLRLKLGLGLGLGLLELGLVGAARREPVAPESAPKQRDVAAHLGAGRAQGGARGRRRCPYLPISLPVSAYISLYLHSTVGSVVGSEKVLTATTAEATTSSEAYSASRGPGLGGLPG